MNLPNSMKSIAKNNYVFPEYINGIENSHELPEHDPLLK